MCIFFDEDGILHLQHNFATNDRLKYYAKKACDTSWNYMLSSTHSLSHNAMSHNQC